MIFKPVITVAQRCQAKYKSHNTDMKATTQIQKPQHKHESHNTNTKATTEVTHNGMTHNGSERQWK